MPFPNNEISESFLRSTTPVKKSDSRIYQKQSKRLSQTQSMSKGGDTGELRRIKSPQPRVIRKSPMIRRVSQKVRYSEHKAQGRFSDVGVEE